MCWEAGKAETTKSLQIEVVYYEGQCEQWVVHNDAHGALFRWISIVMEDWYSDRKQPWLWHNDENHEMQIFNQNCVSWSQHQDTVDVWLCTCLQGTTQSLVLMVLSVL